MTGTQTQTLTAFLLARYAEEEAEAKLAAASQWSDRDRWTVEDRGENLKIATGLDALGWSWEFAGGSGVWQCDDPEEDCGRYQMHAENEAAHIVRWDPARVLAECAAKRRIVELHQNNEEGPTGSCGTCTDMDYLGLVDDEWPCQTIRALASVYADHPEFQEAWK